MKNMTLSGEMPGGNVIARFVEGNRKMIVEVISALFILLFLYTAISKTHHIQSTVNVIKRAPLISSIPVTMAWAVVIIEYTTSLLLFLPKTRKLGLYISLGLMLSFTLFIGYMMLFAPTLPCSCGGIISKMTWNQHLIFNILVSMLALTAVLFQRKTHD